NSRLQFALIASFCALTIAHTAIAAEKIAPIKRYLYVASPGVRNYLQWGGHGVLIFDIDNDHKFLRRISLEGYGLNEQGKILNIKGVCASAKTNRLYVSTLRQLIALARERG
ncbi:MAG: hypothetical protein IIC63_05335, partial [Proteobacteria bacterium]|nr:hypothetical protein [Pseudomonadota bacterium]